MAIEIQKRPHDYCFSGNPVHYQLFSQLAISQPETYFEVRLRYRTLFSGPYLQSVVLPHNPTNGIAKVNVQDMLDSVLEYQLPAFGADEKACTLAAKQTAQFYIEYRELTEANPDPSWDSSEADFVSVCIKGGLDYFIYRGNNFWVNYYDVKMPFLTWQQSGRLAGPKERLYLAWFNKTTAASLRVNVTITYTDLSTQIQYVSFACPQYSIAYIPTGAAQLALADVHPEKKIDYWEVQVMDTTDTSNHVPASELFRYYIDNRQDYNDVTLHYRCSIGGLDSVRVRGVITPNLEYDFTRLERIVAPDYYDGDFINPQLVLTNSGEKVLYKGDIGHLGKEEQDRLRDAFLIRETWREVNKKWWPVSITTSNNKLGASDDQLWTLPIEWQYAVDKNYFYTPRNFDFGDAVFTNNVCRAYLGNINVVVDTTGATATITFTFTESDPDDASTVYWYQLIGFHANPVAADTAIQPVIITGVPLELVTTLELQCKCDNNYKGPKTTIDIDTRTAPPAPGTGGTSNCKIINNTNWGSPVMLTQSDGQYVNGYVGNKSTFTFTMNDATGVDITIQLAFSPSLVTMNRNYGSKLITGNTVKFFNVDYASGYEITLY